jgi:hypothetical protein
MDHFVAKKTPSETREVMARNSGITMGSRRAQAARSTRHQKTTAGTPIAATNHSIYILLR